MNRFEGLRRCANAILGFGVVTFLVLAWDCYRKSHDPAYAMSDNTSGMIFGTFVLVFCSVISWIMKGFLKKTVKL